MEETGNLLIMMATIALIQQGDVAYLAPYTELLNIWAFYLNSTLPNPGNQVRESHHTPRSHSHRRSSARTTSKVWCVCITHCAD